MTKAQARRRIAEAGTKILKVMIAHPEACSPMMMNKITQDLAKITKKLQ
jgi:hypothetical protein